MKRLITALLAAVLCIVVSTAAYAQQPAPVTVVKLAKWGVWGPNGITGTLADTTHLAGADGTDTTAAIYIGDMNFSAGGLVTGPGATTAMNGIKVFLTGDGIADDVDSVYYKIDQSPDGVHWLAWNTAATTQNMWVGAIAGVDQANGTSGTTVNNCLGFFIKVDQDVVDAGSGTAATWNSAWGWAPYVRIHIKLDDTSTNEFKAARLFVAYPGYRESH